MGSPRTWLLASPHAGDNSQLHALANALGWPYEAKRLAYRNFEKFLRLLSRPTLSAVNAELSDPIAPPYPDLIIAAGRAAEAVAFWIRRHGNRDVRVVFIGTPWSSLDKFDLVLATPQYSLPNRANVMQSWLPLHAVHPMSLGSAARTWLPRLRHLPRPWIAVLVGGSSGPYVFGPSSAERLGREASQFAKCCGGSLLVSTSARTGRPASHALAAAIAVPHYFYGWTDSGKIDNPYLSFLALAQQIIVTADSVSMIAEACATGKPVLLFDIDEGKQSMRAEESRPSSSGALPPPHWRGRNLASTAFRLAMRFAPPRWSRDLRIVHGNVVAAGLASWIGEAPRLRSAAAVPPDLEQAVSRVRALFCP